MNDHVTTADLPGPVNSEGMLPAPEFANDYVPLRLWGKDHWSMLGYLECVATENAGFLVCYDPRMRHGRRHFRIMPAVGGRRGRGSQARGVCMDPLYGTRLNDGRYIPTHDDWHCVQDFAKAGVLTVGPESVEPGVLLHLSEYGKALAGALRVFKQGGGSFGTFSPPVEQTS